MEGSIILSNGVLMPIMSVGTNWMKYTELLRILKCAVSCGFRAFDTARSYGNEDIVGQALKKMISEGDISRDDIFITTKVGNTQQMRGTVLNDIDMSLRNLKTDYIDLWLMHWPLPDFYEKSWEDMIKVYETGKVRAIGVANFDSRHIDRLIGLFPQNIPMVNQIECHPLRTCEKLKNKLDSNAIKLQAYAPLCRMIPLLSDAPVLNDLSRKYHKTVGQIILRWHIQMGSMPVFKTYREQRFKENADIFDFELTDLELNDIFLLDQDYKYHLESVNCPGY